MARRRHITDAVILAAGNGSRLASATPLPKPLVPVGGRPLLGHVLGNLPVIGIERVLIVVGYRGEEIVEQAQSLFAGNGSGCGSRPLDVEWLWNHDFRAPNGVSLLAAEGRLRSPFLLLMSDHLFDPRTLREFIASHDGAGPGVLATDSKISQVFDLGDATKVQSRAGLLQGIGKDLGTFDAVDTGMFVLNAEVFPALHRSREAGDASLTGGIATLARNGAFRTWDIGPRRWIDVDTPEALAEANRLMSSQRIPSADS